jgi:hypothetical protein
MHRLRCVRILLSILAPLAALKAQAPPNKQGLTIVALDGQGAVNNLKTGTVTLPIVEVRDASLRPVAGAEVVFHLPADGPGGTFAGGATEGRAKTNATGQARAPEFTLKKREGQFFIDVTAQLADRAGSTRITQSNLVNPPPIKVARNNATLWKILGIAGGGAITVGLIMLSRGGDDHDHTVIVSPGASGSTGIVINPGSISVGGPR